MRRALFLAALVAVAAFAAGAWSAAPPTPTEKRLTAQIKKLQADVKTLKTDTNDLKGLSGLILLFGTCNVAMTADALQGTWQVIDQLSTATQAGKTYFGPQTPIDDSIGGQSACTALQVARSQAVPPTAATFVALLGPLHRAYLSR